MALQCGKADGFEQAVVHACIPAALFFLRLGIGGKAQDDAGRDVLPLFMFADRPCQFIAVHDRHITVGNDQVEVLLAPGLEPRRAMLDCSEPVPEETQLLTHEQAVGRMVVHHQHIEHRRSILGRRLELDQRVGRWQAGHLQRDKHLGADPGHAAQGQLPSHHFA